VYLPIWRAVHYPPNELLTYGEVQFCWNMRKPYEHATKLTDDGLITRTAAQLMELRTELADAVRSITSDPVPRDLVRNKFELSQLPLHSSLAGQSFISGSYLCVLSQAARQL
jgi:hypothetical protein